MRRSFLPRLQLRIFYKLMIRDVLSLTKCPRFLRKSLPGASRGMDGRTLYYDSLALIFPHERLVK